MAMLNKVRPGDPLKVPADTFNTFIDAARDFQNRQRERGRDATREFQQAGIVLVKNESGADRGRFDILGISGPVFKPTDNLPEFTNHVVLRGVKPRKADRTSFVILLEPLIIGAIGRAVLDGVGVARVQMVDENDRYADRVVDDPTMLRSSVAGGVHLIWIQPPGERDAQTPDIAWCVVRIGALAGIHFFRARVIGIDAAAWGGGRKKLYVKRLTQHPYSHGGPVFEVDGWIDSPIVCDQEILVVAVQPVPGDPDQDDYPSLVAIPIFAVDQNQLDEPDPQCTAQVVEPCLPLLPSEPCTPPGP